MTFSELAQIICPILGDGSNVAERTRNLLLRLTNYPDEEKNPILDLTLPTFKSYYNGQRSLHGLAKKIYPNIDTVIFDQYISDLPEYTQANLSDALSKHYKGITCANVGSQCAEILRDVIATAAMPQGRKKAISPLPAKTDPIVSPDISLDDDEYANTLYIDALCEIYTEHHGTAITEENIHLFKRDNQHLERNKVDFINAYVLHRKLRDTGTDGFNLYQKLEDDVYRGIIDPWEEHDGETGYAHFYAVVDAVKSLQFHAFADGPIKPFLDNSTLIGLLHMLVNHERIDGWVHHDD